jgi:hypothetical protein
LKVEGLQKKYVMMKTSIKSLILKILQKTTLLTLFLCIMAIVPERIRAQSAQTTISDCFSRAAVIGETNTGGLIGSVAGNVVIERTYSAGLIPGMHATMGGLIGTKSNESAVVKSYWDTHVTTQALSAGGEGRPTSQMTQEPLDQTYQTWDFSTIWTNDNMVRRNSRYPYLTHKHPHTYSLYLGYNNPTYGSVSGSGQYGQGTLVRITATPRSDNAFIRWTDFAQQEISTQAQLDIEMPASTVELMAHFTYSTSIVPNDTQTTKVFPNPFGHTLTIHNHDGYVHVRIINVHGQRMHEQTLSDDVQHVLNTSFLPPGIYMITLHKPNHQESVFKVIKGPQD